MDTTAKNRKSAFNFRATGIGSLPSLNAKDACLKILDRLPEIPFWPQLVKRSHLEDMNIQISEGLPLLEITEDKRALDLSSEETESQLVTFYDRFLADDIDYFAISQEYAPGLFELVELVQQDTQKYGPYIKGQTVGPVTFAASIKAHDGKSILHHQEFLEAMVKGLSIKTLWQVRKLGQSGKKPIIFLDEPYLSGFGSAFSPVQRHEVVALIKEVIGYVRERSDSLIGVHCCGNTDWSMIMETDPDIVHFDASEYLEHFLLYPKEIVRFLRSGGTIAWGIVPTHNFTGEESVQGLYSKLEQGIKCVCEWGLDREAVTRNAMLTPACGMGTMEEASADTALSLLSNLAARLAEPT